MCIRDRCYSGQKVDLFAVGVLLFTMVAQHPPFKKAVNQDPFYKLFCYNNEKFWEGMAMNKPPETFSSELKAMINSLLAFNPMMRPSIAEIKSHLWYNGPDMTEEELRAEFRLRREKIEDQWKIKAAKALKQKMARNEEVRQRAAVGELNPSIIPVTRRLASTKEKTKRLVPACKTSVYKQTVLYTIEEPDSVLEKLKEYFAEQECEVVEDEGKYKLQAKFAAYESMRLKVEIEEAKEEVYCIRMEKDSGSKMNFISVFNEMKMYLDESNIIL
eukprot:TRINITY_DN2054_c0_g1_i7.p1 TRINITY_DN2054_c0_g1~~TRINITY_DN2054_c0_g1_i7.p1  ORF type:complete len:273 (+),score=70.80 TRINITY_DN2054_c0_g1_i7:76-894(+)